MQVENFSLSFQLAKFIEIENRLRYNKHSSDDMCFESTRCKDIFTYFEITL